MIWATAGNCEADVAGEDLFEGGKAADAKGFEGESEGGGRAEAEIGVGVACPFLENGEGGRGRERGGRRGREEARKVDGAGFDLDEAGKDASDGGR